MELAKLQELAKPYLIKNNAILATIDGQFFYERDMLYALAHVGGKKELVFRIVKADLQVKKEVSEKIIEETPKVTEVKKEVKPSEKKKINKK